MKTQHHTHRLRHFIILITCYLLHSISVTANGTGEIRGRILDSLSREPIVGATVSYTAAGTLCGTITDVNGYFKIKPLNPGYYDLNFRFVGYQQKTISGIYVTSDKIENMRDIYLSAGSIKLITVIGYPDPLIKAEDPTAIPIGLEEIQTSVSVHDPMALISTATSDIKTSPDGKKLYFRGERAESVMYIVDGVKTRDGQLGVPGSAIGHMTVYTGGVPAKYGDFSGGVVVIETQSYFDIVNRHKRP